MAADFLGTFTKSQFDRLTEFARRQVGDINARVKHLEAERARIGIILFRYDGGNVVAYKGDPSDSYIGKLLSAYEVLGGDAPYDLQIRQKDTQALYLMRADEGRRASRLSDGRTVGGEALADAPSAVLMQRMTSWMYESLRYKREAIERKIRCALDYSDQLNDEIKLLTLVKEGNEVEGSLENVISQIGDLIQDRMYRAIADDKGQDPNGLMAYAPFLSLEPGPNRPATEYGRGIDGYVTPEEDA